jgi:nicotinamide mononucleotide adenylyltransferase
MEDNIIMINSAEEFVRLRRSKNIEEYSKAANEDAPISVWLGVIEKYSDMKEWVVHNKTVPLEILDILSKDPDPNVRFNVAQKKKLSPEIFERLSKDADESVRLAIARNPKTPHYVLKILMYDEWEEIKKLVKKKFEGTETVHESVKTLEKGKRLASQQTDAGVIKK